MEAVYPTIQVESGFIEKVGYDPAQDRLAIAFKGGKVSNYEGVGAKDGFNALLAAHQNGKSVGQAYHRFVKDVLTPIDVTPKKKGK